MNNNITPIKAIRKKCLECSCGSTYEVKKCVIPECSLYLFRMGKNPNRKGIGNMSPNYKVMLENTISST